MQHQNKDFATELGQNIIKQLRDSDKTLDFNKKMFRTAEILLKMLLHSLPQVVLYELSGYKSHVLTK